MFDSPGQVNINDYYIHIITVKTFVEQSLYYIDRLVNTLVLHRIKNILT